MAEAAAAGMEGDATLEAEVAEVERAAAARRARPLAAHAAERRSRRRTRTTAAAFDSLWKVVASG